MILVVREYDKFSRILEANNFEVINFPLVETKTIDDLSDFEAKLEITGSYDGVFLTSRHAAEIFRAKLIEKNLKYAGKVYVLGSRSYELLKDANLDLVFNDSANTALEMLEHLASDELKEKRFLFIRGAKSLRIVPDYLKKNAAFADEAIVYEALAIKVEINKLNEIGEKFATGEIAVSCFFSPSAAENFIEQFGAEILHQTFIATIGKTTADYFETLDIKVGFVSPKAETKIFAESLSWHLKQV